MIGYNNISGFAINVKDLQNFAVNQNLLNPSPKGIRTLTIHQICKDAKWYMDHASLFKSEDSVHEVRTIKEYQHNIDQRLCSMCWKEIARRGGVAK
jgi:hypothetical protein